ncbi:aspartate kinase [Haloimpatiens lingqiaonensis]|uniref:aspartate kinase n=1 Tax=Haloimpatiens lingqiaonensis TaxID=1380675 RepID=UPI0010FCF20B|nr:aspartate kinase [Haloimpatiens lingqiaonensis]
MKIIVQKFGGTSVSTHEKRLLVMDKVMQAKRLGYSPVVVVSAMGRKGEPYATDTLLSLVDNSFKAYNPLGADLLMSCGEIISTVVMSYEFSKKNISAVPLTGGQAGIITDGNYGNAEVKDTNVENIMTVLESGQIPIIAGFQGRTEDGYITTLGRGASDFTAAILGVALKAEKIEIYTDVDGIMTADPRVVSEASLIKEISYNEVFQFADQGAKVIHPRAVDVAMKGNVPLVIKNTLTDSEGTIINILGNVNSNNIITGITSMDNRSQVRVKFSEENDYNNIFEILANNSISIDLINIFPKETVFTINEEDMSKFNYLMEKLELSYSIIENCSKISIIGSRMRGIPGVMARILKVLTKENIEVLQTADSHTTIWCLVESKNCKKAINALHKEFKLG